MNPPETKRPPAYFSLSADFVAAVLATVVLTVVAMDRPYVDAGPLTWLSASAQVGPGVGGGAASLLVWLLWGLQAAVGDVLWAAKLMGVLAGTGCVVFATRALGPWAGLWLLGQLSLLGAVAAADPGLVVVMCLMGALSFGLRGGGFTAGVFAGLAVGAGPWAWPAILWVVWTARQKIRVLLSLALLIGMWHRLGAPVIPAFSLPSAVSLAPWERVSTLGQWVVLGGLIAVVFGSIRRARPPQILFGFALFSLIGALCIPSTPAPLLHIQFALVLGLARLEWGRWVLAGALVSLGFQLDEVMTPTQSEVGRAQVIRGMSGRPGSAMCTTETFVRPSASGWLVPCVGIVHLGLAPTAIHPEDVLAGASQVGADWFAVEERAILFTYPWLQDLLEPPYPAGFSVEVESQGWRVFKLDRP